MMMLDSPSIRCDWLVRPIDGRAATIVVERVPVARVVHGWSEESRGGHEDWSFVICDWSFVIDHLMLVMWL